MSETLDKEATVKWIRSKMESMGKPPAYSYQMGKYHGMERVLNEIESGKFDTREEKKIQGNVKRGSVVSHKDTSIGEGDKE